MPVWASIPNTMSLLDPILHDNPYFWESTDYNKVDCTVILPFEVVQRSGYSPALRGGRHYLTHLVPHPKRGRTFQK